MLPLPWELEYATSGKVSMAPDALRPADPAGWRAAAGVPADPDPLGAFDDDDLWLTSLLSLAAPTMYIHDSTFGGTLDTEYAALFTGGRLRAAFGIDHEDNRAFCLEDGAYYPTDPPMVDPTAQCAELLDERFRGRFLFDGYLPRRTNCGGPPSMEPWSSDLPAIDPLWAEHFPVLKT